MWMGSSVAPFTGAWIEISTCRRSSTAWAVAPFTGAWIEMDQERYFDGLKKVAPFTGAWIEITFPITYMA